MNIVGETEDGKQVVDSVFKMYDTFGLPLVDLVILIRKNDLIIDWISFYEDAEKAGWKNKTIMNKIEGALVDAHYDKDYKDEVIKRLRYCILKKRKLI